MASSTLEAELMHAHRETCHPEMDLLKDLPSHDRENFSKFSQGSWKSHQTRGKSYIRLKNGSESHALEIVMDPTSLLLRELEKDVQRENRVALKRGGTRDDESRKVPRLEQESDTTLESLD